MLSGFIEKYKDPYLVREVQEFFGVKFHQDGDRRKKKRETNRLSDEDSSVNGYSIQPNGSTTRRHQEQLESKQDKSCHEEDTETYYTITNNFWYYLFLFGTELGDEIFYVTFIPFWFWNIDGAVGRRIVLVWSIIMTVGQALKDIICWPRPPCPPAARLQKKWSLEYGMPSTHAMIGVSIPFSVVLFSMNRYVYSVPVGVIAAVLWCSLICVSRVYLGMHTVLDIIAGLGLATSMLIFLVPLVDTMDHYFLTTDWAVFLLVAITLVTIVYYPCSDKWTPTRGDTTLVVSVTAGIYFGSWLNYKTGALLKPLLPPPYNIIWPSWTMFGRLVLRTVSGMCCILGTKATCKSLSYATLCAILRVNSKELEQSQDSFENKNKILVDLVYKYIACFMIGFNTVFLLPNVFTILGIERPTFYTEW